MDNTMPILLVPGLVSSPRIYAPVIPALWRFGPVTVANHIRDDNMGAIARRILAEAPPRFALAGHSMGGYIAFEIMRQAPERVAKAGADQHPGAARYAGGDRAPPRHDGARARPASYRAVLDELFPGLVHPSRHDDAACASSSMTWATMSGPRLSSASRPRSSAGSDSRPTLAWIKCPTLVLTGDQDNTIPNALSKEMADGIPGAKLVILPIAATCRSRNSRRRPRRRWSNGCGASCFRRRERPRSGR